MLSKLRGKQVIKITRIVMRGLFVCIRTVYVNGADGNLGMHSVGSIFRNYRKWKLG